MIRPGTSLTKQKQRELQKPELQDFLKACDYVARPCRPSLSSSSTGGPRRSRPHLLMWLAYSLFHNGDYKKAIDVYDEALAEGDDPRIHAYKACCHYALTDFCL
ncbi:unnamed protein product [Prorocentrum cordatum]|uniref:Intraflagellar transport protein 56 n=1 Tax=Prorocentrum cordatum TaxID=2364126 RepID=A0ABN9W7U3_9DINO|nr:unnamed protein product [Polarella glacialis]